MFKLTHTCAMPYGKHQGTPMQNVPADYLLWLHENGKCSERVAMYVNEYMETIERRRDIEKEGRKQRLSMRMPFGSYQGWHVQDIPAEYLEVLYESGKCPKNLIPYIEHNITSIREKAQKDRDYRAIFRSGRK